MHPTRLFCFALSIAAFALGPSPAFAQSWPQRTVRVIMTQSARRRHRHYRPTRSLNQLRYLDLDSQLS